MKEEFGAILTTDGKWVKVSLEDWDTAISRSWHTYTAKAGPRGSRSRYEPQPYARGAYGRSVIGMHRLLLSAPLGKQVDHINHDTLDNRRENLRIVTRSENMRNTRDQVRPAGLPRCVYRHKSSYRVEFKRDGRIVHRRVFRTIAEAVAYRDGFLQAEGFVTKPPKVVPETKEGSE